MEKFNNTFRRALDICLELDLRPTQEVLLADASRVLPEKLIELLSSENVTARSIVDTWLSALNSNWKDSNQGGVFVITLFRTYFESTNALAREIDTQLRSITTASGAPLSRQGSWFEATRRLVGTLYHLGRLGESTPPKRKWLGQVVELTGFLLTKDRATQKPANMIRCLGFRGVSCALLARTSSDPVKFYREATVCLRKSRELGDISLENGQYYIESCLHLAESTKEEAWLVKAELTLIEVLRHPKATRRAFALSGESHLQRGFAQLAAELPEKAFQSFIDSESSLSKAFGMPVDSSTSDDYILHTRGRSRYMLFTTASRLGKPSLLDKLEGAIEDLMTLRHDGGHIGHGGTTLPNALFIRARMYYESGEINYADIFLERARSSIIQSLDTKDLLRSIHITRCIWDIGAALSQTNLESAVGLISNLLSFRSTGKIPFAPLVHAARTVIKIAPSMGEKMIEDVILEAESILNEDNLQQETKRFAASHAGGLALYQAKQIGTIESYHRAYSYYRIAISSHLHDTAAEVLGLAGEVALRLGKLLIYEAKDDEAEHFLHDAIDHFSAALRAFSNPDIDTSSTFQEVVAHSKLGECALRLNALNGDLSLLDQAISSFECSKALGNDSAELLGLYGDAFYRRGRYRNCVSDLYCCAQLKEESRLRRDGSRENLSVSARVHFQIAGHTNEIDQRKKGIALLSQSMLIDPDWPWPLFQMLELVHNLPVQTREDIVADLPDDLLSPTLKTAFRLGDESVFFDSAISCVLRNMEFERMRLGGRQDVYVVDDPHRLLSESYVFKHTKRRNAEHDMRTIANFGLFLKNRRGPNHFQLPNPLRITPLSGDDVVYLMRKAHGIQLGRLVIQQYYGGKPNAKKHFQEALRYLAYFHAWSGKQVGASARKMTSGLFKKVISCHLPEQLFFNNIPVDLPLVRKKDAHPENWLLAAPEIIVMLDFEATSACPLLLDVVQLIDDYPLFSADDSGWRERIEMANVYMRELNMLGYDHKVTDQTLERVYAVFAIFRCAFGIRHQLGERDGSKKLNMDSISALKAIKGRIEHYRALLRYLSRSALSAEIRQTACLVLETTDIHFNRNAHDEG